ncbi:glycoside hydrolase family 43 protein [Pedobacter sp. PF22-3]|uniref:glycoside hydrolase family 43 protein n=1 Tax=Pedobacter sp. PF22-3 TaxID=2994467 RepID=UPI002247EED8|nr:glycoside hydrolase family 43 protein [Pedobacter sp. PF22-3]MCX2492613.1 glycoside hydrolase family 43 protein [Pedobacter sp. PF22-3]
MKYIYALFFCFSLCFISEKIVAKQLNDTLYLADPTVFVDKGTYYLYGTSSDQGFLVYVSKDLKNWKRKSENNGFALKKGDAFGSKGFWAPQVFKRRNTYYMAYTADEQIAIAQSKSPLGPFKQEALKAISGTGKQIDPFVFTDTNGKNYLYHVKLDHGNRIFVTELKADFSDVIPNTSKLCLSGIDNWENTAKTDWPVTEGPTVIKKNKHYYLFYSANDFRNTDYAVGYATSSSPTGPWKKYAGNPIISKKLLKINGTGHGDFFTDKNGNLEYVFHTHHNNQKVSPRATAIIKAAFVKDKDGIDEMQINPESFRFLMQGAN